MAPPDAAGNSNTGQSQSQRAGDHPTGGRRRNPGAALLSWRVLDVDRDEATVVGEFVGKEDFTNPGNMISGGFVAAMLDTLLSATLGAVNDHARPHVTTSLNVSFIGAAPLGPIRGRGHVVRQGRSVAFTEGDLRTKDGQLLATATATARFIEVRQNS